MRAFIFDTGAGQSGLQSNPPDSLGFRVVGEGVVASIFGVTSSPILAAERLRLGPLTIDDPVFMTMDFAPFEAVFGEPIGGIIGYDVFRRTVVEVDLEETRLTIHDPTTYTLTEGTWRALRFQDNHPIVSATVEGIEGLFRLDLGAAGGPHGNLVLNSPAVERHGFLDSRETVEAQLGVQPVAMGRIASFDFAGVRFDDLDVAFGLTGEGLFHDVYTMGNIGVNVLRRFRILFDYGRARIALIPKPQP